MIWVYLVFEFVWFFQSGRVDSFLDTQKEVGAAAVKEAAKYQSCEERRHEKLMT